SRQGPGPPSRTAQGRRPGAANGASCCHARPLYCRQIARDMRVDMQAVILAGGFGTRISEESHLKPKPMIEIGSRPILWHIMKIYARHGITDFVICLGYRGHMIKEYFANYVMHSSDMTVDARTGEITYHGSVAEPWRITLIDTGEHSMTGGRLKR